MSAPQTMTDTPSTEYLYAYTDGSGTLEHRAAGAGVVVVSGPGDDDADVVVECARHLGPGTNNHAELCAALCALDVTAGAPWCTRPLIVRTDSNYVIGAATRREEPHEHTVNGAVIGRVRRALRERTALGHRIEFEWVRGHATKKSATSDEARAKRRWNHRADALAKHGRLHATPELFARTAVVVGRVVVRENLRELAEAHRGGVEIAPGAGRLRELDRGLLVEHGGLMREAFSQGVDMELLVACGREVGRLADRAEGAHTRSVLVLSAVCSLAQARAFDEAQGIALAALRRPGLTPACRLELGALMEGFVCVATRTPDADACSEPLAEGPAAPALPNDTAPEGSVSP